MKESKRIAYLLVVHKNPVQVNIFIEQLLKIGNCDIFIHVDSKNKNIIQDLKKGENIYLYSEYDVKWGSFEIVESAIFLMKKIRGLKKEYQHIYFGSGQDLIIKNGLLKYLAKNNDKVFIQINRKSINNLDRRSSRYRISWPKFLLIRNDLHLYRFIRITLSLLCKLGINLFSNKKKLNRKVEFYEGRTWFICPFKVMNYFLDYLDDNQDYIEFWRDSLAADLMFFQTLIMNSPFNEKVEDELMFVEFGKRFRDMNHPYTLTLKDISRLENSNKYFARKFEEGEDREVIKYFKEKVEF